jgi:hypothetical protein
MLSSLGVHPVLVDVGASGDAPSIWKSIAEQSVYVGFDPDLREIKESTGSGFYKRIMVNEAITADPAQTTVGFYLTRFPFCSSTLKPDTRALSNFHFCDLFTVDSTSTARAGTLDSILQRLAFDHIDWLKLDTQGTDLRIFMSLSGNIRSRVLALDVEPGLIDAYKGEDLFVDTHRVLLKEGFWLADLNIGAAVRVRESSLNAVTSDKKLQYSFADWALKKSPAYCEARYLRTLESMHENRCCRSEYALLWVFAVVDSQYGFAMDVALEYESLFGRDQIGAALKLESSDLLKQKASTAVPWIKMKRLLKRLLGRDA